MGDDNLDILLTGPTPGRRRSPGLRVADILTLPEDQQAVVNWLIRHYEATPTAGDHAALPLQPPVLESLPAYNSPR